MYTVYYFYWYYHVCVISVGWTGRNRVTSWRISRNLCISFSLGQSHQFSYPFYTWCRIPSPWFWSISWIPSRHCFSEVRHTCIPQRRRKVVCLFGRFRGATQAAETPQSRTKSLLWCHNWYWRNGRGPSEQTSWSCHHGTFAEWVAVPCKGK